MISLNELERHEKRKVYIIFFTFITISLSVLIVFTSVLLTEKRNDDLRWNEHFPPQVNHQQLAKNATQIFVGTYIENVLNLNLKGSELKVAMNIWFNWTGDEEINPGNNFRIYSGQITSQKLLKSIDNGNQHYRLYFVRATLNHNFNTVRFPLESHQIHIYLESTKPIQQVVFTADKENSGMNRDINISGYKYVRNNIADKSYTYDTTHGDPEVSGKIVSSEIVSSFELNRTGAGLYIKCFVALIGTLTWALITLFLSAYHRLDPLSMLPAALFGTVTNIIVGANLVPDDLNVGLLEFGNIWGIIIVISITVIIININKIRSVKKDSDLAHKASILMFWTVLTMALLGEIILPLAAYKTF